METDTFADFVARQQGLNLEPEVDWNEIRAEWLADLGRLYSAIVGFLDDYVKVGSITYSFTDVSLNEENLGSYLAKRMDVRIGRQLVSLEPLGTLFIGYKGVVNATGPAGQVQLVLVNESAKSAADLFKVTVTIGGRPSGPIAQQEPAQISWAWKVATNTPNKQYVDLDKESLFAVLMEVANA